MTTEPIPLISARRPGPGRRRLVIFACALGLLLIGLLVLLFVMAPNLYPANAYQDSQARAGAISATRTAAMAGFVGVAAIGGLVVNAINAHTNTRNAQAADANVRVAQENVRIAQRAQITSQQIATQTAEATRRTLELTERGEITERYMRAVELIGAKDEMSCIGGIYALERLTRDSPADYRTVVEVLSALIRDKSAIGAGTPEESVASREQAELMQLAQVAMIVLSRIAPPPPPEPRPLRAQAGLRSTYVAAVRDSGAGADLRNAFLSGLDLGGSSSNYPDLRRANLTGALLTNANLGRADLRFARLTSANLDRALLFNSRLTGADLSDARLRGADFSQAQLGPRLLAIEGVRVDGANFEGAIFEGADLRGVNLERASGLTTEQLEPAVADEDSWLPPELKRPTTWPKRD